MITGSGRQLRFSGGLASAVTFLTVVTCWQAGAAITNIEYNTGGNGITVSITSPANDNTWIPVNGSASLMASASDLDQCRTSTNNGASWSNWSNYYDDVTSGTTSTDYHMIWSGPGNPAQEFAYGRYGTSVTYYPGPYGNAGDKSITCTAYDYDRTSPDDREDTNGDTTGSPNSSANNDGSGSATRTIHVWQVTVTTRQSGSKSTNNDIANYAVYGDPSLGFVTPNNPAGCAGYHGKTEFKGVITSGAPYRADYLWCNFKKGTSRHAVSSDPSTWIVHANYPDFVADGPDSAFADSDPRHPNATGTDTSEIYGWDGPGFAAGLSNDSNIAAPDNWCKYEYQRDFKVLVKSGSLTVSNECLWAVTMALDVSSGHWTATSHTP